MMGGYAYTGEVNQARDKIMNDYEVTELRKYWKKPGKLKALLTILPLTPEGRADSMLYKRIVSMTGITYEADFEQVYAMLEEDGVLVREGVPPPAVLVVCNHPGPRVPCLACFHQNQQAKLKAGIRYRLAKPLADY